MSQTLPCTRCGEEKEPTRVKSRLCRKCDREVSGKPATPPTTADTERLDKHATAIRALRKRLDDAEAEIKHLLAHAATDDHSTHCDTCSRRRMYDN